MKKNKLLLITIVSVFLLLIYRLDVVRADEQKEVNVTCKYGNYELRFNFTEFNLESNIIDQNTLSPSLEGNATESSEDLFASFYGIVDLYKDNVKTDYIGSRSNFKIYDESECPETVYYYYSSDNLIINKTKLSSSINYFTLSTKDSCTICAEENGGKCGLCGYSCAIENGVCVTSTHHKELWSAAECAENATSKKECNKCDGYTWNTSSDKCVAKNSIKAEDTDTTLDSNFSEDKEEISERRRPKVKCGNVTCIPKVIPRLTSLAVTIIQIAVPILLVIMGSIDLFKGITAGKEDEMKKGQQMFIKRLVVGALVFFIIAIVKLLVSVVANATDTDNISKCITCFVDNNCEESTSCN